jgi:hypothetical protein
VIDEAHHLLPGDRQPAHPPLIGDLDGLVLVAPHAGAIAAAVLRSVELVIALGEEPAAAIRDSAGRAAVRLAFLSSSVGLGS